MGSNNERRRWTMEEEQLLKESNLSNIELANILNRTPKSIGIKKVKLGCTEAVIGWTNEEEKLLRDSKFTNEELSKILNRTVEAIYTKRARLGCTSPIRYWTAEEEKVLIESNLTNQELADLLGRTVDAICKKKAKLDCTKPTRPWTTKEQQKLWDTTLSNVELSKLLNRTEKAIARKRIILGIKNSHWTEEEEKLLRESKLSNQELAKILNRTPMAISKKKVRMGIGLKKLRWRFEEDLELEDKWHWVRKLHIKTMNNRSQIAIKKRGLYLNLGPRYNGGGIYLTTSDVGSILGMKPEVIRQDVLAERLKARLFGNKKIAQITPESMLSYMYTYLKDLDSSKINWESIDTYVKTHEVFSKEQKEQIRKKRLER